MAKSLLRTNEKGKWRKGYYARWTDKDGGMYLTWVGETEEEALTRYHAVFNGEGKYTEVYREWLDAGGGMHNIHPTENISGGRWKDIPIVDKLPWEGE